MFRSRPSFDPDKMDVDPPDRDISHWAQQPQQEEGPARKRLHSDIDTPLQPFRAHPTAPTFHYGPETPFLLNVGRLQNVLFDPPKPAEASQFPKYNPAEWPTSTFLGGGHQDVDMEGVETFSPIKPLAASMSKEAHEDEISGKDGEPVSLQGLVAGSIRDNTGQAGGKAPEERKIAKGAVSRVKNKRIRDAKAHEDQANGPLKTEHTYNLNMNSPSMRHSEIPALLLGYLQFFVNASVVVFVLYLAVQFVLTVRRDVEDKMAEASVEILQEISECSQLYLTNRCDPAFRVPAMDAACRAWDVCMRRDPTFVGRINVMAETFAGVLNSFVDNISWKTMAFTIITLSFLIILTNSALFNLRQKATPTPPPTPHHMFPALGQAPWLPNGQHNHSFPPQGYLQAMQPGYLGQDSSQTDSAQRLIGGVEDKKKGWRPW